MTKRLTSLFLVLALCLTFFPVMASAEDEDTNAEPTQVSITSKEDLQAFADAVNNGDYDGNTSVVVSLDADLDLTGVEWTPIGQANEDGKIEHYFSGTFCGNGHTISDVTISSKKYAGLFGYVGGTIQNLFLDKISISGDATVAGALAGDAGGAIKNCHVTDLTMDLSAYCVGGFIGYTEKGTVVSGCTVSGIINEKRGYDSTGGFVGCIELETEITYCGANVILTVAKSTAPGRVSNVGGFIGDIFGYDDLKANISNCYSVGNITGGSYVGGFAGSLYKLNIKNCYATGDVTQATASMASFLGTDAAAGYAYGSIKNCYATGNVIGTAPYVYAFAQQDQTNRSPMSNCYYNSANTPNSNEKTTGKTLDAMKEPGFANVLNNNDTSNGWIYQEGQTPLCGAEPADYSAVETALGEIPSDLTLYTKESVAALNEAKSNVVMGKMVVKQAEVNKMAEDIEKAIEALVLKDADYTEVNEAITKANALNKSDYKDFTKVEEAVNAVKFGLKINEQAEVDAMAKAINDAIAALEKKSSSSGSGSSRPSYSVTTPSKPDNGTVTVDPANAKSGNTVTITVTPDSGYKLGDLVVTDKDGKKLTLTDKGNGQYTFTMPSSAVTVAASFEKEAEARFFDDVAKDAYYYDAVKWAVANGVTNGVSENLFGPEQACTRAQIVTFLWRAAGSPEPKNVSSFADVAADAYYAKAVAWAVENGVTKGTSETTFSPDETCTRAQGVTFLYRVLGKLAAAQAGFTDVTAEDYYADAVNWAAESGVTKGISETLFGPSGACTRAQIVTFLYRAYVGN